MTSLLIQKAGFESYRASPCAEYQPPEGWSANCPGARYAIEQPDEDRRFSYEVTPIGTDTYTLIAAVMHTDRTLGLIRTDLSAGARPFAILVKGVQDGRSILADRAKVQIGWMVIWSAAIVLVAIGWMCVLSDRKGIRRVWGGTWRGLLVSAPFAALYWRYESDVLVAVDVTAAIAAITIAAVFGWRATHRQEKGAAR